MLLEMIPMSAMFSDRRVRAGATAFALAFTLGLSSGASAKVLAKVNGVEITDEDLATARDDIGPGLPAQLEGAARDNYILDYLIDGKIVAQKAQADKMDQTPDFAKKIAYYREKLMMETLNSLNPLPRNNGRLLENPSRL